MRRLRLAAALCAVCFPSLALAASPTRTWTDEQGNKVRAKFVRVVGANVILLQGTKPVPVPFLQLSPEDRDFVRGQVKGQGITLPTEKAIERQKEQAAEKPKVPESPQQSGPMAGPSSRPPAMFGPGPRAGSSAPYSGGSGPPSGANPYSGGSSGPPSSNPYSGGSGPPSGANPYSGGSSGPPSSNPYSGGSAPSTYPGPSGPSSGPSPYPGGTSGPSYSGSGPMPYSGGSTPSPYPSAGGASSAPTAPSSSPYPSGTGSSYTGGMNSGSPYPNSAGPTLPSTSPMPGPSFPMPGASSIPSSSWGGGMAQGKACGKCNKPVPDNLTAGDKCPHCGVRWSYDNTTGKRAWVGGGAAIGGVLGGAIGLIVWLVRRRG